MITPEQSKEFEKLARPLIKFLNDNTNPHTKIIIDTDSAEIVYGKCAFNTYEYIND